MEAPLDIMSDDLTERICHTVMLYADTHSLSWSELAAHFATAAGILTDWHCRKSGLDRAGTLKLREVMAAAFTAALTGDTLYDQ